MGKKSPKRKRQNEILGPEKKKKKAQEGKKWQVKSKNDSDIRAWGGVPISIH